MCGGVYTKDWPCGLKNTKHLSGTFICNLILISIQWMWQSLYKAPLVSRNCSGWWDSVRCNKPWGRQLYWGKICGFVISDITLRLSRQVDPRNYVCKRHKFWAHVPPDVRVYSFKVSHRHSCTDMYIYSSICVGPSFSLGNIVLNHSQISF